MASFRNPHGSNNREVLIVKLVHNTEVIREAHDAYWHSGDSLEDIALRLEITEDDVSLIGRHIAYEEDVSYICSDVEHKIKIRPPDPMFSEVVQWAMLNSLSSEASAPPPLENGDGQYICPRGCSEFLIGDALLARHYNEAKCVYCGYHAWNLDTDVQRTAPGVFDLKVPYRGPHAPMREIECTVYIRDAGGRSVKPHTIAKCPFDGCGMLMSMTQKRDARMAAQGIDAERHRCPQNHMVELLMAGQFFWWR